MGKATSQLTIQTYRGWRPFGLVIRVIRPTSFLGDQGLNSDFHIAYEEN